MDIVDPLPTKATQKKFLLVATDYFNKWVELEVYASIKDKDVSKFVWKNIYSYSEFHEQSSWIMGPNLTVLSFKHFAQS